MEIAQNFMGKNATNTMIRINENGNVVGTIIVNCEDVALKYYIAGVIPLIKTNLTTPRMLKFIKPLRLQSGPKTSPSFFAGFPETTTLDSLTAATYSTHMRTLSHYATNALKEIDVTDELVVLRLVTHKTEAVVAPDSEFHLIVVMRRT